MKSSVGLFAAVLLFTGCDPSTQIDRTPPAAPRGIRTVSLANNVEISWLKNTEPDVAGYRILVSSSYNGQYQFIGKTTGTIFDDQDAKNGVTYYYALSAYDFDGNESELSADVVYDTPRPEGFGSRLANYRVTPSTAGYDFSTYSVGRYDDEFTDFFFDSASGKYYLDVWNDTDIQDMGYTKDLDEISAAPTQGWSPSKFVEAIFGHTYVIWTWDDRYAKVRVKELSATQLTFDWAYQTAKSNPELKRNLSENGKRQLNRSAALSPSR